MSVTEISVKRPAAITMVIVLLVGLGILGYTKLGADLLPSMTIPVITVSTSYSGASADDVKKDIVKPMEDAVSGIAGVDTINSTSREGSGTVIIQFKQDADMNTAFLDVQKSVSKAQGKLPSDAGTPVISKIDTNAMSVMTLALSGTASFDEIYNQADKIKTELEKVPGVGQVSLGGADKKELMIKLDKTAIEYYGITINSILSRLKSDNVSMPAGQIKQDKISQSIRVVGEFQNIDEVKNVLISTNNGGKVRLGEIADIKLEYPEATSLTKLNSKKTISLDIQKQSDANVVEVVNNIKDKMTELEKTMPKNMNIITASDTTVFIKNSLSEINHSVIEGIITTAIVLLFFLKSWRSSLVVLVAIPTSLISTFFMMYELKFTLNMMSLMALSLCIGILVDDSIVVLENIQRHLAQGKNPIRAAIEGRKEIGMAAVAITLCDVVVFLPIAFMSGVIGQYFKQFGLTIVFATLFSLFVSFTITPMLASRLLKHNKDKKETNSKRKNNFIGKISGKVNKFMESANESYKKSLVWSLNNRLKVVSGLIACIIASVALVPLGFIGTEFMSNSDQSAFSISMSLTPGTNLKQTDEKAAQVDNYLKTIKEVKYYYTQVSEASVRINVTLVPKEERQKSQTQLASQVRSWGKKQLTGVRFTVSESQMGGGGGGGGGSSSAINIKITGDNADTLKDLSKKVEEEIKSVKGTVDITNSLDANDSELRVKIDRLAAAQYGVSASDVASALRTGIQGSAAGTYRGDDDEYDMTLKFMDGQIKSASDIGGIKIQNSSSQQISLDQVASIVDADSPKSIRRENRQDIVTVSASLDGRDLGSVNNDIRAKIAAMSIPVGYSVSYGGSQKQMADTFGTLAKAIIASIVLVYMILVVLYESFLTPLVRMLALPCAVIGALGILAITGNSLNMMSLIGFIMLDGLASKNGTLLIDYTNTLMKQGMNLKEALIEAGTTRLRPIIMTSLTMVVGMLPSALALGEGSETRAGMAWVIIGGMITSTILSPIILPVVYTMMDDFKHKIFKNRNKKSYVTEVN
ncbi:efflux RND transporter permease subunit [Clostridium magnum]|uniref:Multidrug resistance protein MdtC n=1 Tax=Clostridium magnum DSM 2767 TaxID=1121326 RepID=A0A161X5Z6_9CLOT|nr:efflux RND transporter permease subunit [Clostridium magnum]KZL89426.1 multidrug resistance protein MdtC [Clostridium magnum DSM 2767]SHI20429.1 hydrophobic/amphiphilic exporter-1, HAE1 family [Clostridium magnum DSM 2767]